MTEDKTSLVKALEAEIALLDERLLAAQSLLKLDSRSKSILKAIKDLTFAAQRMKKLIDKLQSLDTLEAREAIRRIIEER